jgi:hypothetical protein
MHGLLPFLLDGSNEKWLSGIQESMLVAPTYAPMMPTGTPVASAISRAKHHPTAENSLDPFPGSIFRQMTTPSLTGFADER